MEIFQLLFRRLPFREVNKEVAMAVEATEGRKRKPYHLQWPPRYPCICDI